MSASGRLPVIEEDHTTLAYQVDLLSDQLDDTTEELANLRRDLKAKRRECAKQERQLTAMELELKEVKRMLEVKDILISGISAVVMEEEELGSGKYPGFDAATVFDFHANSILKTPKTPPAVRKKSKKVCDFVHWVFPVIYL